MKHDKEVKPAESRKERKLKREVAELQIGLRMSQCEASANRDAAVSAFGTARHYEERANHLSAKGEALQRENDVVKQAIRVTAEGLMIERDELLARARRLGMRIQGLGFTL